MLLIADCLEYATQCEQMAALESDAAKRERLLTLATRWRELSHLRQPVDH
jgi:hypothetical protein